jgi:hypothetical protein
MKRMGGYLLLVLGWYLAWGAATLAGGIAGAVAYLNQLSRPEVLGWSAVSAAFLALASASRRRPDGARSA